MTVVCHVVKATRLSGAERHLLILLPALRALGIDARLLLLVERDKPMDSIAAACAAQGVPLERLVVRRGLDLTIVSRLTRTLRAQAPAIVHTHLIHADIYGMLAARAAGVPTLITTRHNDDAFRRQQPVRLLNALNWRAVRAGVVISQSLAGFVRQVESAPAHKVHVIPYGLPHTRQTPAELETRRLRLRAELGLAPETLLLGIISRLIEQKGIPYAIQAVRLIADDFPQAHLVIAGDGDRESALRQQAATLGLGPRVHFLGWRQDAPDVIAALDVFLMPSLWEGFGLTLLEAMSARVPVVASHVSAIPEVVVHGETGYLVAPRDPEAIAHALRLLLPDRLLRQHLGLNGEDRLETFFSVERMARQTADLYAQVLYTP
jgi:glycosyltransferase involved in cell wall biosynthesis